jgi:hypothetical protein
MPIYRVRTRTFSTETYEVEAATPEEAEHLALYGDDNNPARRLVEGYINNETDETVIEEPAVEIAGFSVPPTAT